MHVVLVFLAVFTAACGTDRIVGRYGARVEYQVIDGPAPTPESAERAATALPACPFGHDIAPETWAIRRPRVLAASVRIPRTLGTIEVGRDRGDELWAGEDGSLLSFSVSDGRGSYVFAIDSDSLPVDEITCGAPLAGRLAAWNLVSWPGQRDTIYTATARAVLGEGLVLDVGALAPTPGARVDLLRTLLSLERATIP